MYEEIIKKALEKADELAYSDCRIHAGTERIARCKEWERDGAKRGYINIDCYTLNGRYKGRYKCGYIDLATGEYVNTKYDDVDLAI